MPYVKIGTSEKGNNKGSCLKLVNYLDKENKEKNIEDKEHFFSREEEMIPRYKVIDHIDSNRGQLGKNDAKFYMLTVNPSSEELKHINNDQKALKEYTRSVMEAYAENFNKGLRSKDLVWYAKLEESRAYKGFDKEVKKGLKNQGEKKDGLNTHVHVIVSRKDAGNKLKLSPMTNHKNTSKGAVKGGFNRVNFKMKSMLIFDEKFKFVRKENELERYRVEKYGSPEEKRLYKMKKQVALTQDKNKTVERKSKRGMSM